MQIKSFTPFGLLMAVLAALVVFLFRLNIEDIFAKPKPDGSLLAVLSSPDVYGNKTVTVEGYEVCKFEGDILRVSKGTWLSSIPFCEISNGED